ncbi:hypothetical protein HMPREF3034_01254 [Prevotella sp. DNF00663]|nr:hypothetical protein HMPREF3034_01254 [Prevotella sp. DNF00663]
MPINKNDDLFLASYDYNMSWGICRIHGCFFPFEMHIVVNKDVINC